MRSPQLKSNTKVTLPPAPCFKVPTHTTGAPSADPAPAAPEGRPARRLPRAPPAATAAGAAAVLQEETEAVLGGLPRRPRLGGRWRRKRGRRRGHRRSCRAREFEGRGTVRRRLQRRQQQQGAMRAILWRTDSQVGAQEDGERRLGVGLEISLKSLSLVLLRVRIRRSRESSSLCPNLLRFRAKLVSPCATIFQAAHSLH